MADTIPADVVGELRAAFASMGDTPVPEGGTLADQIVEPKERVFARFGPVFAEEHLPELTEEEFRSFLVMDNNHHWTGLHRQGSRMCQDMPKLRDALQDLLYGEAPIDRRLDRAIERIYGMGKAIATAVLLIAYPDRYGVWNRISEGGMQRLGIWPDFERGTTAGQKYARINQILLRLRDALDTNLWTLDALWWAVMQEEGEGDGPADEEFGGAERKGQSFGLEKYLHEFMRDNWDSLDLAAEWQIYATDDDLEAGYRHPCPVGGTSWEIDILAHHRHEPRWLVVELKRNRSSDEAVGQTLRYVQWVRQNLAQPGEEVHGLIISREADDAIRYALSAVPFIDLQLYEVDFHLKKPESVPLPDGGDR